MPKTLLDFMSPPASAALPLRKSLTLAERLAPKAGESILMLGYDGGRDSLHWRESGVELLVFCQKESEVVAARKAGLRAVLAHAEYLVDRERFDGVLLAESAYRLFEPRRAVAGITQALRPGGRVLLELPLSGTLDLTRQALDRAASSLGMGGGIEQMIDREADLWRKRFHEAGISAEEAQTVYRHHTVPKEQLGKWVHRELARRTLLLNDKEQRELTESVIRILEMELEREGVLTEEEVLFRLIGRRV